MGPKFYSGGMNMADLCRLRWDQNVFEDRIKFRRQKTINTRKDPTSIVILRNPSIDSILRWFKDRDQLQLGFVFPIL